MGLEALQKKRLLLQEKAKNKLLGRFDKSRPLGTEDYYAPLNQIITSSSVPYDSCLKNIGIVH